MNRLAILSTHPIQYNAPLFRMLHEEEGIELQVFFSKTWDQVKYDTDFQREVTWDIPVSDGYYHSTHDASARSGQRALVQAILAFQPDALLVFGWNFAGHFYAMRQLCGRVPVWFRGDSHLLNPTPFWKQAMRKEATGLQPQPLFGMPQKRATGPQPQHHPPPKFFGRFAAEGWKK